MKIILIEDDSIMANSVRLQLKVLLKNDYELTTFKRLEKAMSYIENNNCDIVISDINLLDSKGQPTIDRLTSKPQDFKLVIISGSLNRFDIGNKNKESYKFIPKDIDFNDTISSVIQGFYR